MTQAHRQTRIDIRVSEEEKHAIRERAKASGYTASDYVRLIAQNGRVQPVPSINLLQWAKLAGLVSNFNQAVRHLNTGLVSAEFGPALEAVQAQLETIRKDLTRVRGDEPQ